MEPDMWLRYMSLLPLCINIKAIVRFQFYLIQYCQKINGVLWCLGSNHRPLDALHYEGIDRQVLFIQVSQKWKVQNPFDARFGFSTNMNSEKKKCYRVQRPWCGVLVWGFFGERSTCGNWCVRTDNRLMYILDSRGIETTSARVKLPSVWP
jgi:hypothetical protein